MILSGSKARRICANYAILQVVPELQQPVENNRRLEAEFKGSKGCCGDQADFFSGVEREAMAAIIGLSPDAMKRLAGFLKEREILAYVPVPGRTPQYKQIFPPKLQ